jgi:hypothetical protein
LWWNDRSDGANSGSLSLSQYYVLLDQIFFTLSSLARLPFIAPFFIAVYCSLHTLNKHVALLLTRSSIRPTAIRGNMQTANTKQHSSSSLLGSPTVCNMSNTYRFTNSSAPAQSSPSFAAQVPYLLASSCVSSVDQQQSPAIYKSSHAIPGTKSQLPTGITHPPVTGEKRKRSIGSGEYNGSNLQPRKKRKMDDSANLDTLDHAFAAVRATECKMVDVFEVVKAYEPLTPPTSPPDQDAAVLMAGPHTRHASHFRLGMGLSPSNSPAALPFTPPHTPPALEGTKQKVPPSENASSSNGHSKIEKVKKDQCDEQIPFVTPPESLYVATQAHCSHLLHPAYSSLFTKSESVCPQCRLDFALDQLRTIQRIVENKGGVDHWRKASKKDKDAPLDGSKKKIKVWKAHLDGGDKRHMEYAFNNPDDIDISHRHCKKRLLNLKLELEGYAEQETAWEQLEAHKYRLLSSDPFDDLVSFEVLEHSARYALEKISRLESEGELTLTEDRNAIAVHHNAMNVRKCLDLENIRHRPNNETSTTSANNTHRPRVGGVNAINANIDSPPKRMCRDPRHNVSFDPEVRVCVENDIDVFRKDTFSPATTGCGLPRSILRTTPARGRSDVARKGSSIGSTTTCSFDIIALRSEAGVSKGRFHGRHSLQYRHGLWTSSPENLIVDTSGANKSDDGWETYNLELAIEADHWDIQDAYDARNYAQYLPVEQLNAATAEEEGLIEQFVPVV